MRTIDIAEKVPVAGRPDASDPDPLRPRAAAQGPSVSLLVALYASSHILWMGRNFEELNAPPSLYAKVKK